MKIEMIKIHCRVAKEKTRYPFISRLTIAQLIDEIARSETQLELTTKLKSSWESLEKLFNKLSLLYYGDNFGFNRQEIKYHSTKIKNHLANIINTRLMDVVINLETINPAVLQKLIRNYNIPLLAFYFEVDAAPLEEFIKKYDNRHHTMSQNQHAPLLSVDSNRHAVQATTVTQLHPFFVHNSSSLTNEPVNNTVQLFTPATKRKDILSNDENTAKRHRIEIPMMVATNHSTSGMSLDEAEEILFSGLMPPVNRF